VGHSAFVFAPLDNADTGEARAKNRRVELRIERRAAQQ
jgi:flagellar motor protein MotB